MSGFSVFVDNYSDHDLQDPAGYYGGFKEGRVTRLGEGTRALSHIWTGDRQGSTFALQVSDFDRRIREYFASPENRYHTEPLQIMMTTRANRAAYGTPYTVFVGPIIDAQPTSPLLWDVTLGDIVSQGLLSDQHQIPWRQIRDSFINELTAVSDALDQDSPEPIIYGQHRRIPDVDPASPQGFQFAPIYLGVETIDGFEMHVWMVAGHACADIPDVNVIDSDGVMNSVIPDEGSIWFIPHYSQPAYEDRRSATYGNDRRYTLIRGLVGSADPDACALGEKTLVCFVDGVEPVGDGSGDVITDRLDQYKHFVINFVAHSGQSSYQAGEWLTTPVWNLFDGAVGIVDEDSFDACKAIAQERLPFSGSPQDYDDGYIGAVVIGASSGDRSGVRRWLADWNRSCSTRDGMTHLGQYRVVMLHPTQAIKEAAPLYTDQYEILRGSFSTSMLWRDQATRVPFRGDYEHTSGQWKTADVAEAQDATQGYGRDIVGQTREYPMAPGIAMAYHLARLEVLVVKHPPRVIRMEASIGPNPVDQSSLGYLDLGDYFRYQHFDAVSGEPDDIRLAQVISHQVQVGKRVVLIEALDCDDLIDYDAPPVYDEVGSPGVLNDTCATAIEVDLTPDTPWIRDIDTSGHATDTSLSGGSPALLPGPGIAYHAAHFKGTPASNGDLFITTSGSDYDTVLAVLIGTCGSSPNDWTLEQFNDNDGVLQSSILEFAVVSGQEYHIVVYGYGPEQSGRLTIGIQFTEA